MLYDALRLPKTSKFFKFKDCFEQFSLSRPKPLELKKRGKFAQKFDLIQA
jgi:hypothetical protein